MNLEHSDGTPTAVSISLVILGVMLIAVMTVIIIGVVHVGNVEQQTLRLAEIAINNTR